VDDYLFEMWFFAELKDGIAFKEWRGDSDTWHEKSWEAFSFVEFSPDRPKPPITEEGT
jgi:hypothetical protein